MGGPVEPGPHCQPPCDLTASSCAGPRGHTRTPKVPAPGRRPPASVRQWVFRTAHIDRVLPSRVVESTGAQPAPWCAADTRRAAPAERAPVLPRAVLGGGRAHRIALGLARSKGAARLSDTGWCCGKQPPLADRSLNTSLGPVSAKSGRNRQTDSPAAFPCLRIVSWVDSIDTGECQKVILACSGQMHAEGKGPSSASAPSWSGAKSRSGNAQKPLDKIGGGGRIAAVAIGADLIGVLLRYRRAADHDLDLVADAGFFERLHRALHAGHGRGQ